MVIKGTWYSFRRWKLETLRRLRLPSTGRCQFVRAALGRVLLSANKQILRSRLQFGCRLSSIVCKGEWELGTRNENLDDISDDEIPCDLTFDSDTHL